MLRERVNALLSETRELRDSKYSELVEELSKFTHNERFRIYYDDNLTELALRTHFDEGDWRAEKVLIRVVKQPNGVVVYAPGVPVPYAAHNAYDSQDLVDLIVDLLAGEGVFQV